MKKIYQWMLAGTLAVMTVFTPMGVTAAETTAVVQDAESEQTGVFYTVSFDANKGKRVKQTLSLSYKDTYGKLPKTTRDGYEFKGWYTKKSGGTKVTAKTVFKGKDAQILYAHWKKTVLEENQTTETVASVETSQTSAQETAGTSETSEMSQQTEAQTELPDAQTALPFAGSVLVNYTPNIKTDYKQNNYSSFLVLKNFKANYLYRQYDYKRFVGSSGKNVGCTATADAMLASIYMDKSFSPNDEGWIPGVGATWTNSVVADGTKAYSVTRQCQVVYDYLNEGKPALIRVIGHSVTAIGVRAGVDRTSITPADILIADPADGKVKCANEMGYRVMTDANGWGIRIPKSSLPAA